MLRWTKLLLLGLPVLGLPPCSMAQARLEIGPLVAGYAPAGSYAPPAVLSSGLPVKPSDLAAMALGLEGHLWLGPRFGLGLQGAVAESRFGGGLPVPCLPPPNVCYGTPPNHAIIATAAAQLLYRPAAGGPLRVSAGVGIVRHGGDAYEEYHAPTPVAGVLGVGLDLPIGRSLVASLGLTTLLYGLHVRDFQGLSVERGTQIDLLPSLTLAWRSHRH